jgi:hypothetical protein
MFYLLNDIRSRQSVNPIEIPSELNRKIEQATKNLSPGYRRRLENASALNVKNAAAICDYIAALKVEVTFKPLPQRCY